MSNLAHKSIPYPIEVADTFFSRVKGLMFKKTPLHEEGLWIIPCNSIHMCFMYFSIDAVFLDKDGTIVKLVTDLKPWRFVKPVANAHSVIELPAGTCQQLGLYEGDRLQINTKKRVSV